MSWNIATYHSNMYVTIFTGYVGKYSFGLSAGRSVGRSATIPVHVAVSDWSNSMIRCSCLQLQLQVVLRSE